MPFLPPPANFGLEFVCSLFVFVLLAKWYAWPYLNTLQIRNALLLLLSPFLLRYLGLMSLVPGVVEPSVTQSRFAFYQAYGDFLAFLLALVGFVLVRRSSQLATLAVWVFNIFGTLDFLHSVIRGAVFGTGGSIGAFWYIPVAYVPFGLVVHFLIFATLLSREPSSDSATASHPQSPVFSANSLFVFFE
jgi:hypothetical protein